MRWNGTMGGSEAKWGKQSGDLFLGVSGCFGVLPIWADVILKAKGRGKVKSSSLPSESGNPPKK